MLGICCCCCCFPLCQCPLFLLLLPLLLFICMHASTYFSFHTWRFMKTVYDHASRDPKQSIGRPEECVCLLPLLVLWHFSVFEILSHSTDHGRTRIAIAFAWQVCHISMLSKCGNDAIKASNHFYLVSDYIIPSLFITHEHPFADSIIGITALAF